MSAFLLLGTRPAGAREVSPPAIARDLVAAVAWCRTLRRWGLLHGFAVDPEAVTGVGSGLIVLASGQAVAERLASDWGRVTGCQVSVTRLCIAAPGARGGS
jgi:hypothetical protein